ncbi:short-chain fatty acids transporter [Caminicella sporogenes DSM 14501]|uniref:Short-chain fatty acids transporter n=1 Tax=Caminicella sporogenes DSM 14501 TaxID=1121266 RepID=A0A1M6QMK7_9FIRM|nr:TIGR00366 family protein [Caminicella sporogenes]RKD25258.1 TIGR00366 family protein [Caminicella sporogenes]SHK21484.1 short-chain fatty acids transporter [Caminicella sporogenes DSM 14501]
MFKKFTNGCVTLVQKYLPDPFLFAVILTFIVLILGIFLTGQTPMAMILHWSNGFWKLLAFSMQMALVLVTGHTLANAPIVKKGLKKLASMSKTPTQAIFAVSLISAIACWINWGFGLVIGALYARQLAKQVKGVDYRLLIGAAYSGFLVWHAGISGSIPLKLATASADLATATSGVITEPISTSQTIFSSFNLIISAVIILTLPLINRAMHPEPDKVITIDPKLLEDETETAITKELTPADKMENSPILSMAIGFMGLIFIFYYFSKNGFKLNLNIVNFIFLFTGIILHGTPRRFLNAVTNAAKGTAGIILQFPFYAGIMGMMTGTSAGSPSLAAVISNAFVNISNQTTFPLFTFLSAGIVNFFVPSGGGQWAVQAPIMMPAGAQLGVPAAKTAMAIAWGDAWTNMIQPFWALPALGIAGLGARDIMGFCVIDLIYSGIIIALGLMFL